MHALFFEVRPKPGHLKHYFTHVDRLRPILAQHPGLVFLDRYASWNDEAVLLSHQLWESEDAIVGWRQDRVHRQSQNAGRKVHFEDYRIRVGARVLHLEDGARQPAEGVDAPQDRGHVVAAYGSARLEHPAFSAFESVNNAGRFVALATAPDRSKAEALAEDAAVCGGVEVVSVFCIRRDYGQHDRAEAPE